MAQENFTNLMLRHYHGSKYDHYKLPVMEILEEFKKLQEDEAEVRRHAHRPASPPYTNTHL